MKKAFEVFVTKWNPWFCAVVFAYDVVGLFMAVYQRNTGSIITFAACVLFLGCIWGFLFYKKYKAALQVNGMVQKGEYFLVSVDRADNLIAYNITTSMEADKIINMTAFLTQEYCDMERGLNEVKDILNS
jgi:hypothetical protein